MKRQDLSLSRVNVMTPPKIQTLMSGATHATQDKAGKITLYYTDGTIESADLPTIEMSETKNFFSIVSAVQEQRGL